MDKKVKYWILLSINQSWGDRGLGLGDFFERRPSFFKGGYPEILAHLNELVREDLIKQQNSTKYKLTEKGEEDLSKYLRDSGPFEMFNISKTVPEFGIKYRLKTIEGFLGSLFIVTAISLIIIFFENYFLKHVVLSFIISTLFVIFGLFSLVAGITITLNFLISLITSIYKPLAKLINKNATLLFFIILIGTIAGAIIVFIRTTNYRLEDIIAQLIIAFILLVISQIKSLKNWFLGLFN